MSKAFSNLLKHIDKLPLTQTEQVYHWVKRYVHVVRFGEYNGRQRYRCHLYLR